MGASAGTKIVAAIPASRAAQATACPWLPALAATTPAARSAVPSVEILLKAPRILNEPVRWRFSAFSRTSRAARRENVSERKMGVTRATPSSRARAASMSAGVGTVVDAEDLLEELAALHGVQDAPKLRVVSDRALEMRLRPRRGHREDLLGQVAPPSLLDQTLPLEEGAVRLDLLPEL